jgi:hypothetical protein
MGSKGNSITATPAAAGAGMVNLEKGAPSTETQAASNHNEKSSNTKTFFGGFINHFSFAKEL